MNAELLLLKLKQLQKKMKKLLKLNLKNAL